MNMQTEEVLCRVHGMISRRLKSARIGRDNPGASPQHKLMMKGKVQGYLDVILWLQDVYGDKLEHLKFEIQKPTE